MKVNDRVQYEGKLGYVVDVNRKSQVAKCVFYDAPSDKQELKISELEKVTKELR